MAHYDQLTKLRAPGFGMMMLATFAEALAEHEEAS